MAKKKRTGMVYVRRSDDGLRWAVDIYGARGAPRGSSLWGTRTAARRHRAWLYRHEIDRQFRY